MQPEYTRESVVNHVLVSGKSVLLERLLMMSILPRGKSKVCIQVRLRHTLQAQTPQLEVLDANTGDSYRLQIAGEPNVYSGCMIVDRAIAIPPKKGSIARAIKMIYRAYLIPIGYTN